MVYTDPSYKVYTLHVALNYFPQNNSIQEQGALLNNPLKTFSKVDTSNSAARHDFPLVCPNCVKLKSLLELISRLFIRP